MLTLERVFSENPNNMNFYSLLSYRPKWHQAASPLTKRALSDQWCAARHARDSNPDKFLLKTKAVMVYKISKSQQAGTH